MIPPGVFGSEPVVADLLQQIRWRDGVSCLRCRSDRTVRDGIYGQFQRYFCKDCDRTFNDTTGTVFAHSKIAFRKWLFSIYAFLRFNTSLRQLQCEIGVTYKTIHRHVERFTEALDAPSLDLCGPVEIDDFYVSADLKGRERDRWSRSRGLARPGHGMYEQDKPPVFVLVDGGTEQRYVVPAKSGDESAIRPLLADRQQEPLTAYTDGFCAYNPLDEDEQFDREYVVHGDGEYADETIHVNTCESHASLARRQLSSHRESQKITPHSISERCNSDENSTANPDEKRSSTPLKPLSEINNVLHKSVKHYQSLSG